MKMGLSGRSKRQPSQIPMQQRMPNIEAVLNIIVEKSGNMYRADAKILSGAPTVGIGKTRNEAKYNLCVNLLYIVANDNNTGVYSSLIMRLLNEDFNKAGVRVVDGAKSDNNSMDKESNGKIFRVTISKEKEG